MTTHNPSGHQEAVWLQHIASVTQPTEKAGEVAIYSQRNCCQLNFHMTTTKANSLIRGANNAQMGRHSHLTPLLTKNRLTKVKVDCENKLLNHSVMLAFQNTFIFSSILFFI